MKLSSEAIFWCQDSDHLKQKLFSIRFSIQNAILLCRHHQQLPSFWLDWLATISRPEKTPADFLMAWLPLHRKLTGHSFAVGLILVLRSRQEELLTWVTIRIGQNSVNYLLHWACGCPCACWLDTFVAWLSPADYTFSQRMNAPLAELSGGFMQLELVVLVYLLKLCMAWLPLC